MPLAHKSKIPLRKGLHSFFAAKSRLPDLLAAALKGLDLRQFDQAQKPRSVNR